MERFKRILENIVRETRLSLKEYIRLQAILGLVTSLVMVLGLNYLGLKNYILIGILIGLVEFLPIVDSKLVFIPWLLVSLFQGNYRFGLGLVVIYLLNLLIRIFLEYKISGEILPFQGILRYILRVLELDPSGPEK